MMKPVAGLLTALFCMVLTTGCMSINLTSVLNPPLEEHVLKRKGLFSDGKILVVDINGEINDVRKGLFSSGGTTPERIMAILRKAEDDPAAKAMLLRINSPGGEVTATDAIFHEIAAFKQRTGIPVYASILSLGCSGAYYISAAADKIYAQPTSIVGSIGVIARMPQLGGLADKIGYAEEIIKSGPMKDMGNPLKPLPAEVRGVIQGIVDSHYARFLDVVVESRTAYPTVDALKPIADGRVYTATQAQDNGLIDDISYLPEVLEKLRLKAGLVNYRVVTYRHGSDPSANLYSQAKGEINLVNIDLASLGLKRQPGVYFLWRP